MSRIAETFTRLQAAGEKALIPFITAGDPDPGVVDHHVQRPAGHGLGVPDCGDDLFV